MSVPNQATQAGQARLTALIVACAFFMQMLDSAIINTSLPQMATSFGVRPMDLSPGITLYMLAMAAFVPASAWVAERFGARRIFLLSILVFAMASLACALSVSLWQFCLARIAQGIGGAMMTPVGRMLVLRQASKSELLQATALITWPALFAPVIGPVLGGFITESIGWQWNFLLNLPLGVLGCVLVFAYVPRSAARPDVLLDRKGFVLSSLGLVCLLMGLESVSHAGTGWPWILGLLSTGAVASVLAVRHFKRAKHPLLDLAATRVQTFSISTLWAGSLFRMSINATPFLLPLLFQVGFGFSPIATGAMLTAYFIGNLGMKSVSTPLLQRFGFRQVLLVNGVIAALSLAGCAILSGDDARWLMWGLMLAAGLSRSMQFTALNTLAFADIDVKARNSASTMASMLQQVSFVLGIALCSIVIKFELCLRGENLAGLMQFRTAFVALAVLAFVSTLMFRALPVSAGSEVSGHVPEAR